MGRKSETKTKYQAELETRKNEEKVCFSEWLRSTQGIAETYLKGNTKYDDEIKELFFPDEKTTTLTLDHLTQNRIYQAVYGYSDIMGQVSFVLGLQMGIKFMKGMENADFIEELIAKEIIF